VAEKPAVEIEVTGQEAKRGAAKRSGTPEERNPSL